MLAGFCATRSLSRAAGRLSNSGSGGRSPSFLCLPPRVLINTRRTFSTSLRCSDQAETSNTHETKSKQTPLPSKRKSARSSSLRQVAVQAERSRDASQGYVENRFNNEQEVEVKTVTAYCAAEQYDIGKVAQILDSVGYVVDPCDTGLYPQVVHVQFSSYAASLVGEGHDHQKPGDIFVFPSGTVVAWDVAEETVMTLVSKGLLPAAVSPHLKTMETEDLEFVEDPSSDKSTVLGDRIRLGTGSSSTMEDAESVVSRHGGEESAQAETDVTLAKIAFSSGLARSAKLAVLESALDHYFESTRSIPSLLSQGSKLPFTRSFILRKTGELLHVRAQLNLYSELTDSLPDLFWESRHELGLEGYFDRVGRALDVNIRIKTLNEKMDYAQEIAAVLRETLSEKHGIMLEWLIIALISIEVVFGIHKMWREYVEEADGESTESLLRQYLRQGLEKDRRHLSSIKPEQA